MSLYKIIPSPKKMSCGENEFKFDNGKIKIVGKSEILRELDVAIDELDKYLFDFHGIRAEKWQAVSEYKKQINISIDKDMDLDDEGYQLEIHEQGIYIKAIDVKGLFYGIQTLIQILKQSSKGVLKGVDIYDYPDIKLRGVLLDLRFQSYRMDYLLDYVKMLSHYKINVLNLEYSNRFPYTGKYETIQDVNVFSQQEVKELIQCCKDHFVEIIPLVQSFGHMEYLLQNEDFKHLREDPEFSSQCCPMNPESLQATRDILQQMMSLHKYSMRVSIGADETFHLGKCDACSSYTKKHGKGGLYVSYVNKLIDVVLDMGFEPIAYADMLLAYPEKVEEMNKKCIIGDWDYNTIHSNPPFVMDWSTKKNVSVDDVPSLSEPFKSLIKDNHMDDEGGFIAFGYTRYLTNKGFKVIGHPSTASTGPDCYWIPQYGVHTPNIIEFCNHVKKYGAYGIINTAWERHLMNTIFYGVILGGEYCWGSPKGGIDEFNQKFAELFYGVNNTELIKWFYYITEPYAIVEKRFPRIYMKDKYGRIDIPLKEIAENETLRANIFQSYDVYEKFKDLVKWNKDTIEQWMLGAEIKKFWFHVVELYVDAQSGSKDITFIKENIKKMDYEYGKLKDKILQGLIDTMPVEKIKLKIEESFKLYDELKDEMITGNYRI